MPQVVEALLRLAVETMPQGSQLLPSRQLEVMVEAVVHVEVAEVWMGQVGTSS